MASVFDSLKQDLKTGKVVVPGDADYEDSLKRWSASCIKPAVSSCGHTRQAGTPDHRTLTVKDRQQ